MKFQIGYYWRGHEVHPSETFILMEPSTYYPTREAAEAEIPRLEQQSSALKGVLVVRST